MKEPITVILVDDDPQHLELLEMSVRGSEVREIVDIAGEILKFTDPVEALAHLPENQTAIIFCDYKMPGASGLDWLPDFVKPQAGPVFVLTSQGDEQIAASAFKLGAADYLLKDRAFADPSYIAQAVNEALRRFRLERRNRELTSELQQMNRELENKNKRLGALTDTAHRFVDNVAHEFRTPLTVVKEFASIMADGLGGPVTEDQAEYLGHIVAASRDLSQMIDDFLDSSKLKTNTLRVDRCEHDVAEVFESVRVMLKMRASSRTIEIHEEIEPQLSRVFCDLEKVGRILINLVVNAVKFSSEGGEIKLWARSSGEGDVTIGVTDYGPGLAPDDLSVICDRFRQVGDPQATSSKGFGLGLNIAKELVWLNLGVMEITSEIGQGSTFAFTLPCCDPERILHRYIESIAASMESTSLTLLQIIPDTPVQDMQRLRQFLCSVCHAQDLVYPAVDRQSLIVLGPTQEPDKWILRLHTARASAAKRLPDQSVPAFDAKWLGTWGCGPQSVALIAAATDRIMGVRACA